MSVVSHLWCHETMLLRGGEEDVTCGSCISRVTGSHMNLVNGLAHQQVLCSSAGRASIQQSEQAGIGIITGDSKFFLCPMVVSNEFNIFLQSNIVFKFFFAVKHYIFEKLSSFLRDSYAEPETNETFCFSQTIKVSIQPTGFLWFWNLHKA